MVSVCQICKEPIWNFFCPDCLAQDIKKWLPSKLAEGFLKFHNQFSGYFHSSLDTTFNWCLSCKGLKEAAICPYCYTNEVIYWLRARNQGIANKFARLFPFDFEKIGHKSIIKSESQPVASNGHKKQLGICDDCGEYSEELACINGEWICDSCK